MNNKLQKIAFLFCFALIVVSIAIYGIDRTRDKEPVDVRASSKTLKFVFELRNESNKAIKGSKFATYLPIESGKQIVTEFKASQDHKVVRSENGNRVLEASFDLIPPYGVKNISISADITTLSASRDSTPMPEESYLAAEKYIEVEDARISAIAKLLGGNRNKQTAQNIYNWVVSNIGDSGYTSQDKGAVFALESRKGDCTEFMYLTIALARALGIHARGVGGYVYKESVLVKSADYHNWAELYFDGQWHVVDGQKKRFLDTSGDYVSMRYLSDKKLSLLGSSHRFSVIDKDLTVKMR